MAVESPDSSSPASGSPGRSGRGTGGRLRTLAALGLLVTASLGVGALLGEVLVRTLAPQQLTILRPDVWQPVDTLGWTHRPEIDTRINTGEREVRIRTDGMGFRVGSAGRVEGERTVLLIGDSFMAALQVEHEQSLAGLMESGLRERLGVTVGVRNTAVGAWDPPHYLLRMQSLAGREPADLLLVAVYVGNDVVDHAPTYFAPREPVSRHSFHVPRSLHPSELVQAVARPLDGWLRRHSHLHVLLRNQLRFLRMRLGLSGAYFPPGLTLTEAGDPRWEVTADLLARVRDEAAGQGIPTLMVLLPSDFQVDTTLLAAHARAFGVPLDSVDIEQPQRLLTRALQERGVEVIDALPALREALAAGRYGYGRIDTHFSPEGHRVVYELLEPHLVARLSGKESPGPGTLPPPPSSGERPAVAPERRDG